VVIRFFSVYGCGLRKQLLWDACTKASRGDVEFGGEVFQEIGFADELRIKERGDGRTLGERGALQDLAALLGLGATVLGG
jgi:hypothetical protein